MDLQGINTKKTDKDPWFEITNTMNNHRTITTLENGHVIFLNALQEVRNCPTNSTPLKYSGLSFEDWQRGKTLSKKTEVK